MDRKYQTLMSKWMCFQLVSRTNTVCTLAGVLANASAGTECYPAILLLHVNSLPFLLCLCVGFWRLLSLQASRSGEEGFVWPQGDAHQTAKRTTGKTVVSSHTAHCSTLCQQQKAKRQIGLHTESVYHKRTGCQHQWKLKVCILFGPRRSFHLSPWPNLR